MEVWRSDGGKQQNLLWMQGIPTEQEEDSSLQESTEYVLYLRQESDINIHIYNIEFIVLSLLGCDKKK